MIFLSSKKTAALLLVLLSLHAAAFAESAAPWDREEQAWRARQDAREKEERAARQDVFLQQGEARAESLPLPEEAVMFSIKTIELAGEDGPAYRIARNYLSAYEGRRMGMKGIEQIVQGAANRLIDSGYVTSRILIEEQDISRGTLRLRFAPGKIAAIRFADSTARANWRTAFPARPGDVLNLRDLEQGLEQLKRVPSRDVDFQIVPADRPGESDVVISAKQGPRIHLNLSIDDAGSEATGKLQLAAGLRVDNLFNANDILRVGKNNDGERRGGLRGTQGWNWQYGVPYGNWYYTVSQSGYAYHQTVSTGLNDLVFSGESKDFRFSVEKMFHRTQNAKMQWDAGIVRRESRSYVDDTEITMQRRKTTAFTLGVTERRYIGQAALDWRIGLKCGVPWLGAQDDPRDEAPDLPTLRYRIWMFDASYSAPARVGSVQGQYRCTLSGQYTRDSLYAADCLSIGNRYTVRGFDGERTLLGDYGFYLQNELSLPVCRTHQIYFGLDYGRVGGSAAEAGGKDLLGAVAGFRGPLGKDLQYEVFCGWALKKPAEIASSGPVYGFQISYKI